MSAVLETAQQEQPLSITLRLNDAQQARLRESNGLVVEAEACEIDCAEMAQLAKGNLDKVIAFKKFLKAEKLDYVRPAKEIIAKAEAVYDAHIEAAERAEGIYRKRLGEYQLAAQKVIEDLRRKQQEEERRRREEAERQAAAARARAEQAAAEARRKAEAEAEAQRKAEAEGNQRAAREAAARRAKAEEEERQRTEAAERDAERIRMEAAATTPTTIVPEVEKIGGLGMRDNWVTELTAASPEKALELICQAVCGVRVADGERAVLTELKRTDLLTVIKFDESAANRLARALKANFNVPGYRAVNRPSTVNRKG